MTTKPRLAHQIADWNPLFHSGLDQFIQPTKFAVSQQATRRICFRIETQTEGTIYQVHGFVEWIVSAVAIIQIRLPETVGQLVDVGLDCNS